MKLNAFVFICIICAGSLGAAARAAPVRTAPFVDLERYLGKWYEVASIPQRFQRQCVKNSTAEYSFVGDGGDNDPIRIYNSCATQSGEIDSVEGRAKVRDPGINAKLRVSFLKLFGKYFGYVGNYWILGVDADYSYAVVGDPSRQYAWILSRTRAIPARSLADAEGLLKSEGYDTCLLLTSVQTGGFTERRPLCR